MTGRLWIVGAGSARTIIARRSTAAFRFFGIDAAANLTLVGVTLTNGEDFPWGGGAIYNLGTTNLVGTALIDNTADQGGAIRNLGTLSVHGSDLRGVSGGGILMNSGGTMSLLSVTVADNVGGLAGRNSVLANVGTGQFTVQNTIVARNAVVGSDCSGTLTSRGHNIVGSTANCDMVLKASDRTGAAGLGTFESFHIPLLPDSVAIDSADPAACPRRDQIGSPRVDGDRDGVAVCDVGAIEFVPPRRRR